MGDVITEVGKYKRGWTGGLPETPCGSGSKLSETVLQRQWIPGIIQKYGILTIADIGAGDLNWIQHMKVPIDIEYQAYDLVPRHPTVRAFDLVQEIPPKVDLIMCLWVLNHLPKDHCKQALNNIKASGSRYLMMTDRPIWRHEQPAEIEMPYLEKIIIREDKGDNIRLIELC